MSGRTVISEKRIAAPFEAADPLSSTTPSAFQVTTLPGRISIRPDRDVITARPSSPVRMRSPACTRPPLGNTVEFVQTGPLLLSVAADGPPAEAAAPNKKIIEIAASRRMHEFMSFSLARISHRLTSKAHDRPAITSLRLLAVLTVLFKYASARQAARASY